MSIRSFIDRLRGWLFPPGWFGSSHEYWQAGDMAVCTDDGQWHSWPSNRDIAGPRLNDMARVAEVTERFGNEYLRLVGWPGWWGAVWFRKLRQDRRQACTDAFKRQMKDCRPKVDA